MHLVSLLIEQHQATVAIGERDRAGAARPPPECESWNWPLVDELADGLIEQREAGDVLFLTLGRARFDISSRGKCCC